MMVKGQRLPMILHEDATELDVWRMNDGVSITLSSTDGRTYAGCQISRLQWKAMVEFVNRQLGDIDENGGR